MNPFWPGANTLVAGIGFASEEAMPELPDVEATRLQVQRQLRRRQIVTVRARRDPLMMGRLTPQKLKAALTQARFKTAGRKGKYFWLQFDRPPALVLHLGMTGRMEFFKPGQRAQRKRSLVLELTLDDGSRLQFHDPRRFGRVWLADQPLEMPQIARLGPDPLERFTPSGQLYAILHKRSAPIKALLLDQTLFAGVGNWIADEILYQARISPHRTARSLSRDEVKKLRAETLKINRRAAALDGDPGRYPKQWLFHYRWSHKKNAQTGRKEPIVHHTVGGRTTAWVPAVQK